MIRKYRYFVFISPFVAALSHRCQKSHFRLFKKQFFRYFLKNIADLEEMQKKLIVQFLFFIFLFFFCFECWGEGVGFTTKTKDWNLRKTTLVILACNYSRWPFSFYLLFIYFLLSTLTTNSFVYRVKFFIDHWEKRRNPTGDFSRRNLQSQYGFVFWYGVGLFVRSTTFLSLQIRLY